MSICRLPFSEYFKPVNYARSTGVVNAVGFCPSGIGSTIMGVALMIGMLVTPYAEDAFG